MMGAGPALNNLYWRNRVAQSKTSQDFEHSFSGGNPVLAVSEDTNGTADGAHGANIGDTNFQNRFATFGKTQVSAVSVGRWRESCHLCLGPPLIFQDNRQIMMRESHSGSEGGPKRRSNS